MVSTDFDDIGIRQILRPFRAIVVPANCADRCNFTEPFEHGGRADVACMNDELRACERGKRFFTDEAVSIGNDADLFDRMAARYRGA